MLDEKRSDPGNEHGGVGPNTTMYLASSNIFDRNQATEPINEIDFAAGNN